MTVSVRRGAGLNTPGSEGEDQQGSGAEVRGVSTVAF